MPRQGRIARDRCWYGLLSPVIEIDRHPERWDRAVSGKPVYRALEFPGKYALLYWLTAIVMSALVVTLPSEICKDTALPVGVPAGMATLI